MKSMLIEKGVGWVKLHRLEPGTEDAVVAALERMQRGVDAEAAIQKLAGELPDGYLVELNIERGSAWVRLYLDGDRHEDIELDDSTMGARLLAALDRAKELAA